MSLLASFKWGSDAKTMRNGTKQATATLALIHCAAEYYAPVFWSCAAASTLDSLTCPMSIHDALRLVTRCLALPPTPIGNLFVLAGQRYYPH